MMITSFFAHLQTILNTTAALTRAHPDLFAGVNIGDGFANTIPWPQASRMPLGITSINKHSYHGYVSYNATGQTDYHGTKIDALGNRPKVGQDPFNATFESLYPEYGSSFEQTESVFRDAVPAPLNDVGNAWKGHGRDARVMNGTVVPCPLWITEVNIGVYVFAFLSVRVCPVYL